MLTIAIQPRKANEKLAFVNGDKRVFDCVKTPVESVGATTLTQAVLIRRGSDKRPSAKMDLSDIVLH